MGFPYLKICASWFLGFLVSRFLRDFVCFVWLIGFFVVWFLGFKVVGFLVSNFLGFLASKFQSSKDSKSCHFSRYCFFVCLSCFLEDIDPMFENAGIYKTDFLDCRSTCLPNNISKKYLRKLIGPKLIFVKLVVDLFLNYLEYPGVSKDKSFWFWESWTRPPSPNKQKKGFRVFVT